MGRGRKWKRRRAEMNTVKYAPPRPAKKRKKLMGHAALEAVWRDGRCSHPVPVSMAYGLGAILSCLECGTRMLFRLRFGRPKTFDVTMYAGGSERHVGRASVRAVKRIMFSTADGILMPEGGFDPGSSSPARDSMMLKILIYTLTPDVRDRVPQEPAADFEAAWRGIDCKHKNTVCQAYCDCICLWCDDCAASLAFTYAEAGMFDVEMTRPPLEPAGYGPHGTDAMARILREYAGTLELPDMMADRMSDDPERDARRLAAVVGALEECGLLRRIVAEGDRFGGMESAMSAMNCNRADFEKLIGQMSDALRSASIPCMEHGKIVSERRFMEALRLAWPCWFEGDGMEIDTFDPTGSTQFCIKCYFSTLDDDSVNHGHWKRGCPECGYDGYLLGLYGVPDGQASARGSP